MGTFPKIAKIHQSLEPRKLWADGKHCLSYICRSMLDPSANPCLLAGWKAKISFQSLQQSRRRSTATQHLEKEAVAIPDIHLQLEP